jgi:hypothetical protein
MPGLAKSSRKGLRRFTAPLPAKVKAPLIDKPRPQPADHRTHRFGALSETIKQAPPALDASEIAIAKISAKLLRPDEAPKSTPKRHPIPDHISRQKIERTTDDNDGAQRGVGAAPLRRERGLRRGERLPGLTPDHCPRANVGEGLVTAARMVRSRLHGLRGLRASVLAGMPRRAWARRPWPTSRPASELGDVPLYRKGLASERDGIDLCRSTPPNWVGESKAVPEPSAKAIRHNALAGHAVFADDAPEAARPRRRSCGPAGAADALGAATPNPSTDMPSRRIERAGVRKIAWLDNAAECLGGGRAGFNNLTQSGKIREVACRTHVRRTFVDAHWARGSAIAFDTIRRVARPYARGCEARG